MHSPLDSPAGRQQGLQRSQLGFSFKSGQPQLRRDRQAKQPIEDAPAHASKLPPSLLTFDCASPDRVALARQRQTSSDRQAAKRHPTHFTPRHDDGDRLEAILREGECAFAQRMLAHVQGVVARCALAVSACGPDVARRQLVDARTMGGSTAPSAPM